MSTPHARYIPRFVGIETDNMSGDAFGRIRTSGTGNRWDCEFFNDKQPTIVDEVVSGTGTAVYDSTARDVVLAVNSTEDASAALYSHIDIPYTPGNSQLIEVTGALGNSPNGFASCFLRSTVTGTTTEQEVPQNEWDVCLNPIDWSMSQILVMDFQSLRVGRIRIAANVKGKNMPLCAITNDNLRRTGFWQTPSLPVYWRTYNSGEFTVCEMGYGDEFNGIGIRVRYLKNSGHNVRAICATVKSEGGVGLFDMAGYSRSVDNGTVRRLVTATLTPVLSLRVKSILGSITNRGLYIPDNFSLDCDYPVLYKILYRSVLTAPVWADVDVVNSGMQYDVSATAVTGGIVVNSGYFSAGDQKPNSPSDSLGGVLGRTVMALGRGSTVDTLTIAAIRTTGTNSNAAGAISWREIR